jgi:hypothetical protein
VLKHITIAAFTAAFLHIKVHNPSLLQYISQVYSIPPPIGEPSAKFWQVFLPITARNEGFRIAFGPNGAFEDTGEAVLHVIDHLSSTRGNSKGPVERTLEGWINDEPCELSALQSLRRLSRTAAEGQTGVRP